jgi:hypothetical protein
MPELAAVRSLPYRLAHVMPPQLDVSPLNRHLFCSRVMARFVLDGAIAVAWICLSGCASSGFYQMSDDWCWQHLAASSARCHRNPNDVVLVGRNAGSLSERAAPRDDPPIGQ